VVLGVEGRQIEPVASTDWCASVILGVGSGSEAGGQNENIDIAFGARGRLDAARSDPLNGVGDQFDVGPIKSS